MDAPNYLELAAEGLYPERDALAARRSGLILRVSQLLIVVLIAAVLWFLRPQTIGGPAAYVTVDQAGVGSTVQPGDLAIVRRVSQYSIGDLVAVEGRDEPAVFGRVVSRDGVAYRVRFHAGAESVVVPEQQIIGRLWLNLGDLGGRTTGTIQSYFGLEADSAP